MSLMNNFLVSASWWSIKKATWLAWLSLLGFIMVSILALTLYIRSLPALSPWHTVTLENEFTRHSHIKSFDAYLAQEEKLFKELDAKIYAHSTESRANRVNRYSRNSFADPKRWERNWNRTFELPVENPKMGVLLLHGMSDSPYSLRTQAELLHKKGVYVVAMRMPGHGTIPAALKSLKWKDMAAVVKIGMKRLEEKVGNQPLYMMGYSTGAALALNYTFQALDDERLTLPKGLIFYSPAIGVSKMAPYAVWQSRLGRLFSLDKMEWNSIEPEYDPFKYNSFAVNAGDQVYRLCEKVQKQLTAYKSKREKVKPFPPLIGFQSIIDNTVSVSDTINLLYKRLPKGEHTLVLFDINNNFSQHLLVKQSALDAIAAIKETNATNFHLDLVSDMHSKTNTIQLFRDKEQVEDLGLAWPQNLFSLSHVAMPISMLDPLYGSTEAPKSPGIMLGHLSMYGESSVLQISPAAILRQRWNPFSTYIEKRILDFLDLE